MIKKYLVLLILIIGFQSCQTFKNNGIFTIYLVRHSEKDVSFNNSADPPLTPCGEQRSKSLSRFFKDVPLSAIYSTDYTRTKNTALPTAKMSGRLGSFSPRIRNLVSLMSKVSSCILARSASCRVCVVLTALQVRSVTTPSPDSFSSVATPCLAPPPLPPTATNAAASALNRLHSLL